jgi:hypothetical protein
MGWSGSKEVRLGKKLQNLLDSMSFFLFFDTSDLIWKSQLGDQLSHFKVTKDQTVTTFSLISPYLFNNGPLTCLFTYILFWCSTILHHVVQLRASCFLFRVRKLHICENFSSRKYDSQEVLISINQPFWQCKINLLIIPFSPALRTRHHIDKKISPLGLGL